jgi:hypothetical protein
MPRERLPSALPVDIDTARLARHRHSSQGRPGLGMLGLRSSRPEHSTHRDALLRTAQDCVVVSGAAVGDEEEATTAAIIPSRVSGRVLRTENPCSCRLIADRLDGLRTGQGTTKSKLAVGVSKSCPRHSAKTRNPPAHDRVAARSVLCPRVLHPTDADQTVSDPFTNPSEADVPRRIPPRTARPAPPDRVVRRWWTRRRRCRCCAAPR